MLCLHQQLDVVVHLAQPSLILPAWLKNYSTPWTKIGILIDFFFPPASDPEGCAGWSGGRAG